MWDGGARVVGAAAQIGRLEPGRRGDVAVLDLRALSAPFAVGDVDVWELLLARGKAAHVDTVIVEGRVLMQGRKLLHLDRDALGAGGRRRRQHPPWPGGIPGRCALDRADRAPDRRALPGARLARRLTSSIV